MRRLLLIFAVVLFPAAGLAQTKIKVGTVRSTVIGGVVSAQARGYFKDAGLDVDIALIDASAAFVPALATNELNVVEGGISANLFNGVAQGLPIKIAFDSTSTPINHSLMLRYDLRNEIKSIRDLKGRTVAVNAPNSIALYEVTRILESADLTINDVQTKVIPFAQMAVAFQTKAIDAGLEITPFTALLPKQELAIAWIDSDTIVKPSPVMISARCLIPSGPKTTRTPPRLFSQRYCAACATIATPITVAGGGLNCSVFWSRTGFRRAPNCSIRFHGRRAVQTGPSRAHR